MKHIKYARSVLFASFFAATTALADTGVLKIKVVDKAGNPIIGAKVLAQSPDALGMKTATTDRMGEAKIVGLDPANNYSVIVTNEGYQPVKNENVLVVSGKSFTLDYELNPASSDLEEVYLIAKQIKALDSTSATVGQDITLDLTESLPTGRSFQSYLQLAPGTKPTLNGNPSSKSGVNYSDAVDSRGNTAGSSTDNLYYIDGINITDNNTGGFGANFNSEIIQEQRILTGGIPAEYEGGSGLISKVITKSGGNEWTGSVNYYFQNDSLVSDNKHIEGNKFSTFDTAFTLGGPLIKDKLWFFASYQIKEREDDISDTDTNEFLRTVSTEQTLGFAKLTYQITDNDRLTASFFNDPYERDGSDVTTTLNNRDRTRDQGGDNYKLEYVHTWDDVILTAYTASHEGEVTLSAANDTSRNDVAYKGREASNAERNMGGSGSINEQFRNKEENGFTIQYFLDTDFGNHDIKFGISFIENEFKRDLTYTGDGAQYGSIGDTSTLADYTGRDDWSGSRDIVADDYARIIKAMEGDQAYYNQLLDTNTDGSISNEELEALTFSSTAGNPHNLVNVYRINMTSTEPVSTRTEGKTFFIQDSWTYNQWTVSAGIRMEEWEHFSTEDTSIYKFDADIAPRFSVVYDIDGDSKVWGFLGRYYDPIRTDMTSFAGTLSGPIREEQVYIGDRWLTYRTRGGSQVQDALFAPTTKTPYTDEFLLGYSRNLFEDIGVEITYTKRTTKDLLEDYDLAVYTDTEQSGSYSLPLSYFGYDAMPDSNYVIATLEGGKREYQGIEIVGRKRRGEDNWQLLTSYTYNHAKGNSNSDGNADLQGDIIWLDPRSPGMWGDQPGNIEHLFKVAGSYFFDNGIELGLVYAWNSGINYSKTSSISSRHIPERVEEPFESGGVTARWIDGNNVASNTSDSFGTLDARVKYTLDIGGYTGEFFLDVFNVLDDQAGIRQQDLATGDGSYGFGENNAWVSPRRFYLGTRWSF